MPEFENIWSDIIPIPQDDGPDPVVKIAYTNEFTQLMDIFRAVLRSKEYSLRTLNLTKKLLDINPANYTIWQFRRECLVHLKVNISDELDYMDTFSRENPKNYQIWHHRRTIVNQLKGVDNGFREINFCNNVFEVDAKNYHAWVHRQWVVLRFQIWDQELDFIKKCLIEDIRNNSAWNHVSRWFCVHKGPERITENILYREFNFCFDSIKQVSFNESVWNYLRGLSSFHKQILHNSTKEKCLKVVEESNYTNIYAISLLADLNEMDGIDNNLISSLQIAQKLITMLINLDSIRAKSWTRRALAVKHLICNLTNNA